MSGIKNWLEEERINEIEKRFDSGRFDGIYLFTNAEARAINSSSECYYQVYGDIGGTICTVAIKDVIARRCDCITCCLEGSELDELVSIRAGLEWIYGEFGTTPIWLWVSSNRFIEICDKRFEGIESNCDFPRQLIEDLLKLFGHLEIQVDEYGYASKDMIPVFVDGKKLDVIVED